MLLKAKNAIVTGSNRGIGRSIVEVLASHGANIWAHARVDTPKFRSEMSQVAVRYGVEVTPIAFDVIDHIKMKAFFRELCNTGQAIHVLVNNAGVAHGGLFQMTPLTKVREVMDINFFAQVELTQAVVRLMKNAGGGSIVNIASVAGLDLAAGNIAYGVSKAALIATTSTLAAELGASGIRVNAVAPGLTQTDMADKMEEKARKAMVAASALKRLAEPHEIANVVAFLASDMASFVSGQVLRVDGGKC